MAVEQRPKPMRSTLYKAPIEPFDRPAKLIKSTGGLLPCCCC
jgi:hypothetical protein